MQKVSFITLSLLIGLLVAHADKAYTEEEKETAAFLRPLTKIKNERVKIEDIRTSLLEEVEATLGAGSATKRLAEIEAELQPLIQALPKNEHGNLGHSGVRYALHRLFVLRHGWHIKGLSPDGDGRNSSSPSSVLKDQVPAYVEDLFEQRLAGGGFTLHELAVLAATVEHLIQNEASKRLIASFNVQNLSMNSSLDDEDATRVLETYMMAYVLGEDLDRMDSHQAGELNTGMPEVFLAWNQTQEFVEKLRKEEHAAMGKNNFTSLFKVAERVGEQFGTFQDKECRELKNKLVAMEYRGTGRVKLADFYKPALDGEWTFQESVGYLRAVGLLDESVPSLPTVMISNYLISKSNCIASSGFYSVCCKNECDGMLLQLEEKIGMPEAMPSAIVAIINHLPSATVAKPQVSEKLRKRLEEIAENHDGLVPLHSRLFAQWMHHVYPRECPYPHISGTTQDLLPDEWMDANGSESTATSEEMKQFVTQAANSSSDGEQGDLAVEDLMPWSPEEELIVVRPGAEQILQTSASTPAALRSMALFAAAGALAVGLVRTMQSGWSQVHATSHKYSQKCIV